MNINILYVYYLTVSTKTYILKEKSNFTGILNLDVLSEFEHFGKENFIRVLIQTFFLKTWTRIRTRNPASNAENTP